MSTGLRCKGLDCARDLEFLYFQVVVCSLREIREEG